MHGVDLEVDGADSLDIAVGFRVLVEHSARPAALVVVGGVADVPFQAGGIELGNSLLKSEIAHVGHMPFLPVRREHVDKQQGYVTDGDGRHYHQRYVEQNGVLGPCLVEQVGLFLVCHAFISRFKMQNYKKHFNYKIQPPVKLRRHSRVPSGAKAPAMPRARKKGE